MILKTTIPKTILVLFLLVFSKSRSQSQLDNHNMQFKGYAVVIQDEITDADGNHIFVGNAKVKEHYAQDRDARLDTLYQFGDYVTDPDNKGIIIITDEAYHIIKLEGLHSSFAKILWDANTNSYWIGGSSAHFNQEHHYQMTLTQLNASKKIIYHTAIETEENTYLQDMILKDQNLVLLAMSTQGIIGETEYIPSIVEITTTTFHESQHFVMPQKVPNILNQTQMEYPKMYRFDFSPLFVKEGTICFGLGHAVDKHYGIRFFRYKEGKTEAINQLGNIEAYHGPYLIGFFPTTKDHYVLTYAHYFTKKFLIVQTDSRLQITHQTETKLASFPDFNRFLELPNGKLVLLSVGKNHYWSYFIFNSEGELVKEIETNVSKKMHLSFLKATEENTLLATYCKPNQDDPVVLQTLSID